MINPKLLSLENGFEDGVVVEVTWAQSVPHRMELAYWEDAKEWSTEYMESIRPLTGPMSIWNHIPQLINSADYPVIDPENWYTSDIGEVQRPFWSRGAGNE